MKAHAAGSIAKEHYLSIMAERKATQPINTEDE